MRNRSFGFVVFILIFLGLSLRFLWLDRFPPGITNDGAELVLSAKTFWRSGQDISGVKLPLALVKTQMESANSAFAPLFYAPILGGLGLTLFYVRLATALVSIITGLFAAKLIWRLTKKTELALIFLGVFLLNPWSIHYSRIELQAPIALMFLTIGLYLLFSLKGRKVFWVIPFFLMATFCYVAALVVVPLVFLVFAFYRRVNLATVFLYFAAVTIFFYLGRTIPESTLSRRGGEITFLNTAHYTDQVNDLRRQTINFPLKNLVINKNVFVVKELIQRYLAAFSPEVLFFSGDPRQAYVWETHGLLYSVDFFLIFIGLIGVFTSLKKLTPLILGLVILGPTASLVSNVDFSYLYRSFPLVLGFCLLISVGIWFLYQKIGERYKKLFLFGFALIYLTSFADFFVFYFFEYPVRQATNHNANQRVVANYLTRSNGEVVVVTATPRHDYYQYLLYSQKAGEEIFQSGGDYHLDKVTFTNNCPQEPGETTLVVSREARCEELDEGFVVIQDQKDAGYAYRIYNDQLCRGQELTSWRSPHLVSDYSIEQMGKEKFCQRWVFKAI